MCDILCLWVKTEKTYNCKGRSGNLKEKTHALHRGKQDVNGW